MCLYRALPYTNFNLLQISFKSKFVMCSSPDLFSDLKLPLPNRTSEDQEALFTWLENNSAEVRGVGIQEFPDHGLGLVALKDISEGDLMIAVPRKLMITSETIQSSKLGVCIFIGLINTVLSVVVS